jgi:hypothetical protein
MEVPLLPAFSARLCFIGLPPASRPGLRNAGPSALICGLWDVNIQLSEKSFTFPGCETVCSARTHRDIKVRISNLDWTRPGARASRVSQNRARHRRRDRNRDRNRIFAFVFNRNTRIPTGISTPIAIPIPIPKASASKMTGAHGAQTWQKEVLRQPRPARTGGADILSAHLTYATAFSKICIEFPQVK